MLAAVLGLVGLCVHHASAHVTLRYPSAVLRNDFTDNVRTLDLCGLEPSEGQPELWQLPEEQTVVTELAAGKPVTVSWDLHYPHQGGFQFELYDSDMTLTHAWNSSAAGANYGEDTCVVDGTQQSVSITLPALECLGCTLRLLRQAKEWNSNTLNYEFKSCARVDVVTAPAAAADCQGCSGNGVCTAGACDCAGNFYGDHCQFENECAEDVDCGSHGLCLDVEDTSGPTKQCFCEKGWFGAIETRESGLQVRVCDTKSALTLDASDFAAGLEREIGSTGGEFEAAWTINDDTVEIAMKAETTSWVAIGMRAAAFGEQAPATPAAGGDSDSESEGDSEGEGASDSDSESETEAESETGSRRRLKKASLPALEDEAEALTGAHRQVLQAGGACAAVDADAVRSPEALELYVSGAGTPAAPGGSGYRRLAAATDSLALESEAAEAISTASRATVSAESGHLRHLAEEEPAPEAPDSESEAPDSESESESESESGSESESEGSDEAMELSTVPSGPCAGAAITPSGAHAMVNQDVIFGAARTVGGKQYFRVLDMFTPSRAKPLPDYNFCEGTACGSDDIEDAIGMEAGGVSYFRFTRKLQTADASFADTCLADGVQLTMIYAYGQLTAAASHTPDSSLEILPGAALSNKDFYKPDVLKFHGGGIGTTYPGRGRLGNAVDLFNEDAPAGGACTASTEAGFDCVTDRFGGAMKLHYNSFQTGDTEAVFGIELASEAGWGALGIVPPGSGTGMVGATAIIVTEDAPGGVGVYHLGGRSASQFTLGTSAGGRRRLAQDQPTVEITEASVTRGGGRTFAQFTVPFVDGVFAADGAEKTYISAYHGSSDALTYHDDRGDFTLALSADAAAGADNLGEDLSGYYKAHAWCMVFAWGVLAPIGVMMALTMRSYGKASESLGPIWFLGHRICVVTAVVLSTIGFAIAVAKFDLQSDDEFYHHKQLGYAVVILGWLQPINAVLRPHPPAPGEKKPALRLGWEVLHKLSGYAAIFMGIANVFVGLALGFERNMFEDEDERDMFRTIFGVWLAIWLVSGAVLFFFGRRMSKAAMESDLHSDEQDNKKPLEVDRNRTDAPADGDVRV